MLRKLSFLDPYWLWLLLALPALGMSIEAMTSTNPRVFHILVHPSGEFSARFLIITMMASPLILLLRGWRGPQWLKKNRRYFGVASFGYALLHTITDPFNSDAVHAFQGCAIALQADVRRRHVQLTAQLTTVDHAAHNEILVAQHLRRLWKITRRQGLPDQRTADALLTLQQGGHSADLIAQIVAVSLE